VFGFGFGSVWVWVVSKSRSLVWFGSKFFVLGLVRFGLHFENLVWFRSQNSELVATLLNIKLVSIKYYLNYYSNEPKVDFQSLMKDCFK
jgi:hypothetical protein